MLLELFLFILLGFLIGIVTGLIPGVHPNLVIIFASTFLSLFEPSLGIVFLVSLAVTNSLIDFIPSIALGAPDEGTELSVLPGHRMLLDGLGYEAIKLSLVGGFLGIVFVTALLPLLFLTIPLLFLIIRPVTAFLLIFLVSLMIFSEKTITDKAAAATVFFAAGLVGIFSSGLHIAQNFVLFPVLSGLFGTPLLLLQMNVTSAVPPQQTTSITVSQQLIARSVALGSTGGIVAGLLPGVGSSEIASLATIDHNDHSFLATVGALTTANIVLSLFSLVLIGRGRSGVAVAIEELAKIGMNEFFLMLAAVLISGGLSLIAGLFLARIFLAAVTRIRYAFLSISILALILVLTVMLTGLFGVLLLSVCTALGVATNLWNVKRGVMMGVLIVPTILFFLAAA